MRPAHADPEPENNYRKKTAKKPESALYPKRQNIVNAFSFLDFSLKKSHGLSDNVFVQSFSWWQITTVSANNSSIISDTYK